MVIIRVSLIAFVAGAALVAATPAAVQQPIDPDRSVFADFTRRVNAYVDIKSAAATTVLPLVQLRDPAEIRRRTEALATVIQSARWGARQGDIFTPEIALAFGRAIRRGCEGDYAALLVAAREDLTAPLPEPRVHGRWPSDAPLPTMLPGVLAALPPLPPGLQYRFMNRALVLHDIDANLVVDFAPGILPVITETDHAH